MKALTAAVVLLGGLACARPNPRTSDLAAFSPWSSPGTRAIFNRLGESGHGETRHTVNEGPDTALWRCRIPASGGLGYRITASVKTRKAAAVYVAGRFRMAGGTLEEPALPREVASGTTDWKRLTAMMIAPPGATALEVYLTTQGPGEAWFRNVEVEDDLDSTLAGGDALIQRLRVLDPASASRFEPEWKRTSGSSSTSTRERHDFVSEPGALHPLLRSMSRALSLAESARRFEAVFSVTSPRYVAGWTSPMDRVFLEDIPVSMTIEPSGHMEAFRGEVESLQLVLAPRTGPLNDVCVSAGDLVGGGGRISAGNVEIHPVGAVRMEGNHRAESLEAEDGYRGWWPDPLLDNVPFDVPNGATQAVWIAVHVPRSCAAGAYTGPITIQPRNAPALKLDVQITVWDFALPEEWHFRNILSWHDDWASKLYGTAWTRRLESKFFDFLTDRRINVTSMYEGDEPYATPERMVELGRRGQNVFVVASMPSRTQFGAEAERALTRRLSQVLPAVRDAGLLNRALAYGWDERGPEWFGDISAAARLLNTRFDGLPLLMAGVDSSYGLDSSLSGLRNISYCPLMRRYDAERAARARAQGNKVWWYETRWTIEQPLIRSRLIPWQTFKADADGFLMWCINRWAGNGRPIENKVQTSWNPLLDGAETHSSGLYVYPGVNGPISSLRLENLRDGIEDYELLTAARRMLGHLQAAHGDQSRIEVLRRAITVPDEFVQDASRYTIDPAAVRERRRILAQALAPSPASVPFVSCAKQRPGAVTSKQDVICADSAVCRAPAGS